jgi:hypothetical protein
LSDLLKTTAVHAAERELRAIGEAHECIRSVEAVGRGGAVAKFFDATVAERNDGVDSGLDIGVADIRVTIEDVADASDRITGVLLHPNLHHADLLSWRR